MMAAKVLSSVLSLLAMLASASGYAVYMTTTQCNLALAVGSQIMGGVKLSTSLSLAVTRDGVEVTSYSPGDTAIYEVVVSGASGKQWAMEAIGTSFVEGQCSAFNRVNFRSSSTQLNIPLTDSNNIFLVVGAASKYGVVSLSPTLILPAAVSATVNSNTEGGTDDNASDNGDSIAAPLIQISYSETPTPQPAYLVAPFPSKQDDDQSLAQEQTRLSSSVPTQGAQAIRYINLRHRTTAAPTRKVRYPTAAQAGNRGSRGSRGNRGGDDGGQGGQRGQGQASRGGDDGSGIADDDLYVCECD